MALDFLKFKIINESFWDDAADDIEDSNEIEDEAQDNGFHDELDEFGKNQYYCACMIFHIYRLADEPDKRYNGDNAFKMRKWFLEVFNDMLKSVDCAYADSYIEFRLYDKVDEENSVHILPTAEKPWIDQFVTKADAERLTGWHESQNGKFHYNHKLLIRFSFRKNVSFDQFMFDLATVNRKLHACGSAPGVWYIYDTRYQKYDEGLCIKVNAPQSKKKCFEFYNHVFGKELAPARNDGMNMAEIVFENIHYQDVIDHYLNTTKFKVVNHETKFVYDEEDDPEHENYPLILTTVIFDGLEIPEGYLESQRQILYELQQIYYEYRQGDVFRIHDCACVGFRFFWSVAGKLETINDKAYDWNNPMHHGFQNTKNTQTNKWIDRLMHNWHHMKNPLFAIFPYANNDMLNTTKYFGNSNGWGFLKMFKKKYMYLYPETMPELLKFNKLAKRPDDENK